MDSRIFLCVFLLLLFSSEPLVSLQTEDKDAKANKPGLADSIRWVTRTRSGSVITATLKDAKETLTKLDMSSDDDDNVYVTRASLFDSSSRVLFQFENYNVTQEILEQEPDLKLINTNGYPIYGIGYLMSGCTATLIGPYHALTTAQCVYDSNNWKTNLNLLRGRKCGTFLQMMHWQSVSVPYEYLHNGRETEYNWAYIQYDRTYKSPLWLSMTYNPNLSKRYTPVTLAGYSPSAAVGCPYSAVCVLANNQQSDRLLQMGCGVRLPLPGGVIVADNDLTKIPPVCAITSGNNTQLHAVTRITKDMFWLLCHWMKESGYDPESHEQINQVGIFVIPNID